jgi:hypothetical protein
MIKIWPNFPLIIYLDSIYIQILLNYVQLLYFALIITQIVWFL